MHRIDRCCHFGDPRSLPIRPRITAAIIQKRSRKDDTKDQIKDAASLSELPLAAIDTVGLPERQWYITCIRETSVWTRIHFLATITTITYTIARPV